MKDFSRSLANRWEGLQALPAPSLFGVQGALPVFIDGHVGVFGDEQKSEITNNKGFSLVSQSLESLLDGVWVFPKPVRRCLESIQRGIISYIFTCHIVTREVHYYQQVNKAMAVRLQSSGHLAHLAPLKETRSIPEMISQAIEAPAFAWEEEFCESCQGEGVIHQDAAGYGNILSLSYPCGECYATGLTLLGRILCDLEAVPVWPFPMSEEG